MTATAPAFFAPKTLLALAVLAGSFFSPLSQAQQVYRIVGADGKVTFSDRAPAASSANVSAVGANAAGGAVAANLPFELRQVAGKFPVTLYTGDNCVPCNSGRSLLSNRGIPFSASAATHHCPSSPSAGSSSKVFRMSSGRST